MAEQILRDLLAFSFTLAGSVKGFNADSPPQTTFGLLGV